MRTVLANMAVNYGLLDNVFIRHNGGAWRKFIVTFSRCWLILLLKLLHSFVQMMNILVVNQSVIDMFASFFMILLSVVERKITGMSRDSIYDQFVCRVWITKKPLWCMLVTSTYGIVLMTLSRYIAVIHPIKYKNVRTAMLLRLVCKVVEVRCRSRHHRHLHHHRHLI